MNKTFEYSERENRARILYRGHYYSLHLTPDELAEAVMEHCNRRDKKDVFEGVRIPKFITVVDRDNWFKAGKQ